MAEGALNINLYMCHHDDRDEDVKWMLEKMLDSQRALYHKIDELDRKVDQIMSDDTALAAAVDSIVTEVNTAVGAIGELRTQISALQAGEVPQSALDALDTKLTEAESALANAVSAAPTPETTPTTPPAEPTPAEGGAPPAPAGGDVPPVPPEETPPVPAPAEPPAGGEPSAAEPPAVDPVAGPGEADPAPAETPPAAEQSWTQDQ